MKCCLLNLFLVVFFIGCNNHKETRTIISEKDKSITNDSLEFFFEKENNVFQLNINDSTKFIFSKIKSFDTSYVIIINKLNSVLQGRILYYPPTYYKDFYNCENAKFFLYKAINFKMDNSEWNIINGILEKELPINEENRKKTIHPLDSKIYFKDKLFSTDNFQDNYFYKFDSILNSQILLKAYFFYPTIDGKIP